MNKKKLVVVLTALFIASLFIIGADWANDNIRLFFHSYFADITIPFSFYLLLSLLEDKHKSFQKWYIKAIAIFALCSLSETLQYFGVYALARVFDPIDYVMYAVGVLLGALTDRVIYRRLFSFWY